MSGKCHLTFVFIGSIYARTKISDSEFFFFRIIFCLNSVFEISKS